MISVVLFFQVMQEVWKKEFLLKPFLCQLDRTHKGEKLLWIINMVTRDSRELEKP